MKQILIDGRIGKGGAKTFQTTKGKNYIRFSLANDTFSNGTNKTEWFDVTSFDPFIVESKAGILTQGSYVIIHGTLNSEVSAKNGKIYLNQYVTADSIDIPRLGAKKDEVNEEQVSTYTGGTKPSEIATPVQAPLAAPVQQPSPAPQATAAPVAAPQPSVAASPAGWSGGDDDLPF